MLQFVIVIILHSTINIFLNMQMRVISQASKLSNEHDSTTWLKSNLHLSKLWQQELSYCWDGHSALYILKFRWNLGTSLLHTLSISLENITINPMEQPFKLYFNKAVQMNMCTLFTISMM